MELTEKELAGYIDHTLLKPEAMPKKVVELCGEALTYGFRAVCVNPYYVSLAHKELKDTEVLVASVVGFPLGAVPADVKANEARRAVEDGADEIDMVMNVGVFRAGQYDLVKEDVRAVVESSKPAHVKVILETGYLTDEEIVVACKICRDAGAAFVKTSTGFGPMGAFEQHVRLMRETVGATMGVKAAGGIRDVCDALRMIRAGADRIGTSAGIAILEGLRWLKLSPDWCQEDVPCHRCPSRAASLSRQPKEVYIYYKSRCRECPYRDYNRFYE